MSYSPRYVRPTKASNLRALANNLRASNEIAPSVAGARSQSQSPSSRFGVSRSIYTVRDSRSRSRSVFSMPNQGKFSESYSGSFNDHTTEPERSREPRRSPQARSHLNTLAESRALSRATSLATSLAIEGGGKSQLRTVQTQYQKLQTLQSEFVESLKSLDPEDSKLIGTYSFVVLGKDESNRLAQSLPAESVQDLKDRCQAAVDSGFMLLYDHLEPIQMARDEFEACHRKEQLKVKLKDLLSLKMENIVESIDQLCVTPVGPQASPNSHLYRDIGWLRRQKQQMESRFLQLNKDHSEQLNRLKAELEAKLQAGEEHWQQTLDELRERLRRSEVQRKENACQLAVQNAAMTAKDSTIASLQADMNKQISRNMELNQVVKGSDGALLFTQKELEKSREHIAYLEEELNEGRQLIDELQQQQRPAAEDIDQVVEEKDRIIGDLQLKVQDLLQLQAVHEEHEPNTLQLDTQISELQQKLKSTEMQLDANDQREEQLHSDLEIVKKELFRSEQLVVKLREHAIRDREKIATCTDEINELKKSIDHLNLASADKDTQLNQVSIQLHAKEEHMGHLYEKLNRQAEKIRFMEEYAKISSDDNARLLQIRNKQHEKNIQLDWEISQLKDNVKELNDYIVRNRQQAAEVLGFEVGNYSLCQEYQNSQPLTQPQGNLESPVAYLEPLNGHFVQQQQQHSNLGSHQPQQRHQ